MFAAIRLIDDSLSPVARAGFRLASLLAMAPFPAGLLGFPLSDDRDERMQVLGQMLDAGVLIEVDELLQLRHALLHEYAYTVQDVEPDAVAGLNKELITHFLAGFIGFTRIEAENGPLPQFQRLHFHILHVQNELIRAEKWQIACELAIAAAPCFRLPDYTLERYGLLDDALDAALELGNSETSALTIFALGLTDAELGRLESAAIDLEVALKYAREHGAPETLSIIASTLVRLHDALGNHEQAHAYAEQYLEAASQLDDAAARADATRSLAELIQVDPDADGLPRAIELHEEALALFRELGDEQSVLDSLINIGGIYLSSTDFARAAEISEQAVALARQLRHRAAEAQALSNLGAAYYNLGEVRRATRTCEKALEVAQRSKDKAVIVHAAWNLARFLEEQGNLRVALKFYELSLANYEDEQVPPEEEIKAKIADVRRRLKL